MARGSQSRLSDDTLTRTREVWNGHAGGKGVIDNIRVFSVGSTDGQSCSIRTTGCRLSHAF